MTVWADWNPDSPERDFDQPHVPAICVANASNEAVYDVSVDYRDQSDGAPVRIDFGAVPPGQTRSRDVATPAARDPRWEPSSLLPRLFFRDAEGRGWMRDVMGRLRPDPGPGNDGFFEEGGRLALGVPRPAAIEDKRWAPEVRNDRAQEKASEGNCQGPPDMAGPRHAASFSPNTVRPN